jgi:CRISPR-associated protein Cmr4
MSTHLVFAHALSPIHCGTGQAVSGIDLPIAREKPTGTPLIPGSSLKGVLRARPGGHGDGDKPREVHIGAFGPDTVSASEHAGAVQFGDLQLLFLPIRSVRGTFGWVTSPQLLRRFARACREVKLDWKVPSPPANDGEALVSGDRLLLKVGNTEKAIFEDFDFCAKKSRELETFAQEVGKALFGSEGGDEVKHFVERACVVSDDVMRVLGRVGMEVVARNRIDNETRTVEKGALWTEEALPVESILAGLLVVTPVRKADTEKALFEHVRSLCQGPLQLGGKASIGRGVCRLEVK